jgi:hypothetical protein
MQLLGPCWAHEGVLRLQQQLPPALQLLRDVQCIKAYVPGALVHIPWTLWTVFNAELHLAVMVVRDGSREGRDNSSSPLLLVDDERDDLDSLLLLADDNDDSLTWRMDYDDNDDRSRKCWLMDNGDTGGATRWTWRNTNKSE